MDAVATYSFGSLAWLSSQALPLIIWPSAVSSLLRTEHDVPSDLESYFARSLGFALIALGLATVLLSGAVPLTSSVEAPASGITPYAQAVVLVSLLHHAAAGCVCYSRWNWTGETGFVLGCTGSVLLAVLGLYCLMFAGDAAMVSKHHRFDQSTSGFPFKNAQSYRAKKKAL